MRSCGPAKKTIAHAPSMLANTFIRQNICHTIEFFQSGFVCKFISIWYVSARCQERHMHTLPGALKIWISFFVIDQVTTTFLVYL